MAHWGQLQYGIWVDKNKTTRTFVEFLAGVYVKQVGYFHISSSSANIVKKGHKKNRPLCAPAD